MCAKSEPASFANLIESKGFFTCLHYPFNCAKSELLSIYSQVWDLLNMLAVKDLDDGTLTEVDSTAGSLICNCIVCATSRAPPPDGATRTLWPRISCTLAS